MFSIKSALGATNEYYLNVSTRVAADALNDIISYDNEQSKLLTDAYKTASSSQKSALINKIKALVKSAIIGVYQIKCLDLDPKFKSERFDPNYASIHKDAEDILRGPFVLPGSLDKILKENTLDTRDEKGYFDSISSLNDCYNFRRIFPNSQYSSQLAEKEEEFEYKECRTEADLIKFKVRHPNTNFDLDKKSDEIAFHSCKTIQDYQNYLSKYSTFKVQTECRIDDLAFEDAKKNHNLSAYLSAFPNGVHRLEALRIIDDNHFRDCKTVEDYERYLKDHPSGAHVLEAKNRANEERLWAQCQKKKSYKLYKEYVTHFPKGKYYKEAEEKSHSLVEKISMFFKAHKGWSIFIGIVVAVLLIIGLIWGASGYQTCLYILGGIGAFCALGGAGALKDGDSACCVIAIIGGIVAAVCFVSAEAMDEYVAQQEEIRQEKIAYNDFNANPSEENLKNYLSKYENGPHKDEVISKYISLLKEKGPIALKDFANTFPASASRIDVQSIITAQCDSLYNIAVGTGTREGWLQYQQAVPTEELRDSQNQIENFDNLEWNTESKAWYKASSMDNLEGYYRYLNLYPNGAHASKANKKIIDMEVDAVMAGEHGDLPSMDQTSYGYGPTSTISVFNNTGYTLTLYYSGPDSKKISISPHERRSFTLKNGSYRCVASVATSSISRDIQLMASGNSAESALDCHRRVRGVIAEQNFDSHGCKVGKND